ncbi:metallophosphoesterase [Candidatus Entotheonella palauensis]|uniref:metallophosphoesterase n=1 Tax=Candidatus Entotheonella palauensis TaxID=93172 RepID=UPI0015C42173|nr:metallophosphoesterase [Candidatus Entotheonella palauensis]
MPHVKWTRAGMILALGMLIGSLSGVSVASAESSELTILAEPRANPWSHLQLHNDSKNFQFAIVTDRTGGHREGIFEEAIRKLNLLQPEFVMSVGDLIQGYTRDEAQLHHEWDEFSGFIQQLQMPFFYLPGNHDIANGVMAQVWQQRFGRAYYHFIYRDVLFLCLNTEEPIQGSGKGAILENQYNYIKRVLGEHRDVRWTLVFMHQPLWSQKAPTGYWSKVEALLQTRRHTVFAGHYHRYVKVERNRGTYVVLATTGGGSRLRGPDFGEFDHVVWVTMTDGGPVVANLFLEGIWDQDVVDQDHQTFMKAFGHGVPLRLSPMLLDEPTSEPQTIELWLTNDKNLPMAATLTLQAPDGLYVTPKRIEITVPPNTVETLALTITPQGSTPMHDMAPIEVKAEAVMEVEGRPPVRVQSTHWIKPEVVHTPMPVQSSPPVIDGHVDEWGTLPFVVREPAQVTRTATAYTGSGDSSFRFGVQIDETFVYVGIEVSDDTLVTKPEEKTWQQDSVAVRFDARALSESAVGRGEKIWQDFLYIAIGPGTAPSGPNVRYRPNRLPVELRSASALPHPVMRWKLPFQPNIFRISKERRGSISGSISRWMTEMGKTASPVSGGGRIGVRKSLMQGRGYFAGGS